MDHTRTEVLVRRYSYEGTRTEVLVWKYGYVYSTRVCFGKSSHRAEIVFRRRYCALVIPYHAYVRKYLALLGWPT